jgi:hypothetical protein
MKRILLASLLVSASAFAAGPYDQPYSIIVTDTKPSADPNLIPVIVNRVDEVTVTTDNKAVVAPGKHKVTLDVPPRKGFKTATQNVLDLETKACTRYYVAAKLATRTGQDWTPVVRSEEPIGECRKKFNIAAK